MVVNLFLQSFACLVMDYVQFSLVFSSVVDTKQYTNRRNYIFIY